MDVRKEIDFFERVVAEFGDSDVLSETAYRRAIELFLQFVKPRSGEVCLDLACGTGAFTRHLRGFRFDLTGIDISPSSIARARALATSERYEVGDIRSIDRHDASADILVYSGVLHHCSTTADRLTVLTEAFRLLRPGGRIFSYDPSAHSPAMFLYRDPRSPFCSRAGKTENEILLDRHQLCAELGAVGFSDIKVRGAAGMTFRIVEGRIARRLLGLYNMYERALRRTPLEDRFGTFLIASARRNA